MSDEIVKNLGPLVSLAGTWELTFLESTARKRKQNIARKVFLNHLGRL